MLILSSTGGFGHRAAQKALMTILKGYEFKIIYPINETRLLGLKSGETLYNTLIYNNFNRLMNWLARRVAPKAFQRQAGRIEKLISENIASYKPDIIVSVIPYINLAASEAARKADIPFLLITIDNDLEIWVHGLDSVKQSNFKITIGTDLPTTRGLLEKYKIKKECIETIGLPLRPQFHCDKTKEDLRKEYQIQEGRSVILLMMGGIGATRCIQYAKKILKMELKTHLFVCVGKNLKLASKLEKLERYPSNALTTIPFTDKIHEFMILSDLLITKPGPGTINEAIVTKTPVLLDQTGTVLLWEKINIELTHARGIGKSVQDISQLEMYLKEIFFDEATRKKLQESLAQVSPNEFVQKIQPLVDSLCQEKGSIQKEFVKIK